jgi:hypothetical protein
MTKPDFQDSVCAAMAPQYRPWFVSRPPRRHLSQVVGYDRGACEARLQGVGHQTYLGGDLVEVSSASLAREPQGTQRRLQCGRVFLDRIGGVVTEYGQQCTPCDWAAFGSRCAASACWYSFLVMLLPVTGP